MKKGCLIAVFCLLLVALWVWDLRRIRDWGIDVDSVEWLPEQASKITFISSEMNKAAEFDIDQDSFEAWCESIGKPLKPVTDGQEATFLRTNWFLRQIGAVEDLSSDDSIPLEEIVGWTHKSFSSSDLYYGEKWPNNGGYFIGYDVSEKRGYYQFAQR